MFLHAPSIATINPIAQPYIPAAAMAIRSQPALGSTSVRVIRESDASSTVVRNSLAGGGMPCLTHWHIWLCHMEVGRTLVLSPTQSTYSSEYVEWVLGLWPYAGHTIG
jgi:hypothetical protein